MSLWATTPIFICFGHARFRSEEEGLDLSILCREGCVWIQQPAFATGGPYSKEER